MRREVHTLKELTAQPDLSPVSTLGRQSLQAILK